jgi:hypothetical protein
MIPIYFGLILIISAVIIAGLFTKCVLIWRNVMMEQNKRWFNDAEKLKKLRYDK